MTSELLRHPLSAAWGDMPEAELQELVDDIEVNGQREPIVLLEGMVLDGWHRYQACTRLALSVQNTVFPADDDPVGWVISRNARRRSLNAGQKALAIVACRNWAPVGNPNLAPGARLPATNHDMAAEAGTSERTVSQAKVVHEKAAPAVKAAVQKGDISVKRAAEVSKLPAEEQTAAISAKPTPKPSAPSLEDAGAEEDDGQPDVAELLDDMQAEVRRANAIAEQFEKAMLADDAKKPLALAIRQYEHAERRRNEAMADSAAAAKRATFYEGQLARIGRAIKVKDIDKIAPCVEAMVRSMKEPA